MALMSRGRKSRKRALVNLILLSAMTGCGPRPPIPSPEQNAARSLETIRFREVSQQAGLRFSRVNGGFGQRWMPETMGGGGAFLDYDNDGWQDILLINGDWWEGHPLPGPRPTLALYRNNRNGTFTDVTGVTGLRVSMQGMGVAVGDYDNDGWDDLYTTGVGGNRLFHNEALGVRRRFVDVTRQAGVGDRGWGASAAWLDYDRDGRLDLFVCHYLKWSPRTDVYCGTDFKIYCRPQDYPGESCRLFHNEGGGRFRDVTKQAGIYNDRSKALGVCVLDLEGNGLPDLIVANDMEPNFVFRNNGDGTFSEEGVSLGVALDESGSVRGAMGIDAAYYRDDDTQGLAIGNFYAQGLAFYDMETDPLCTERAKQNGLNLPSYPYVTFGLFFADFDSDGRADLFITNGHIYDNVERMDPSQSYQQPAQLFRNRGDGTFQEVTRDAGPGVSTPFIGRGACRGDYNNDGQPDILLIPNVGTVRLLRNETPARNHWLTIKLVGTQSNRNAFGARVRVEVVGRVMTAYARSGSSYLSESDSRLHFGLGGAEQAQRVIVRWPSGVEEVWGPIPADRIVTLKEGATVLNPSSATTPMSYYRPDGAMLPAQTPLNTRYSSR